MVLDCASMDELPNFQQKAVALKEGVGSEATEKVR